MRRRALLAGAGGMLLTAPARAIPGQRFATLFDTLPAWAKGSALAWDLAKNQRYFGALDPTDTHAATIYAPNAAGLYAPFAANVLTRTDLGLQTVPTRTNVVLQNRDLTNVAWTATNVTVAKNQTGIDGTASAASSLTATLANGTVLQAITLGSSARWQSAFVKRITGSGTINMTMDNGITWTAVTVTSTTTWTRVEIPTQTLANPTVGFRIVTSGDAIAVDFVQNEDSGAFASAPILVTAAAATVNGNQQVIDLTGRLGTGVAGLVQVNILDPGSNYVRIFEVNDGSGNNKIALNFSTTLSYEMWNGGVFQNSINPAGGWTQGIQTFAFAAQGSFMQIRKIGAAANTAASSGTWPTPNRMTLGGDGFSPNNNSYLRTAKIALSFGAQNQTTFDAMYARAVLAAAA